MVVVEVTANRDKDIVGSFFYVRGFGGCWSLVSGLRDRQTRGSDAKEPKELSC